MKHSFSLICPKKKVAKKDIKTILIKLQNLEKCRVTVLLCVIADGAPLPLLLIFRAKPGGKIEQKLNKDKFVINIKCFIS